MQKSVEVRKSQRELEKLILLFKELGCNFGKQNFESNTDADLASIVSLLPPPHTPAFHLKTYGGESTILERLLASVIVCQCTLLSDRESPLTKW